MIAAVNGVVVYRTVNERPPMLDTTACKKASWSASLVTRTAWSVGSGGNSTFMIEDSNFSEGGIEPPVESPSVNILVLPSASLKPRSVD